MYSLGREPIAWTVARQMAERQEKIMSGCARDEAMEEPTSKAPPIPDRTKVVNDLSKEIRTKITGEITVCISDTGTHVVASWNGFEERSQINGTRCNLMYINRAGEQAVDKLCRELAEFYVSISEILQ